MVCGEFGALDDATDICGSYATQQGHNQVTVPPSCSLVRATGRAVGLGLNAGFFCEVSRRIMY